MEPPAAGLPLAASTDHRRSMVERRAVCEDIIAASRGRAAAAADSVRRSLAAARSLAAVNVTHRKKLDTLKDLLRELESDLAKALSVKTSNATKLDATAEYISITTSRINQLRNFVTDQKSKKNEYAAVISNQLVATETLESRYDEKFVEKESLEEAVTWYHKVLGFQVTGGEGVKFIFDKINFINSDKEYSFSIKLEIDQYRLLQCNPYVENSDELIKDLNRTDGLFNFVRAMRGRFQAIASNG